jgi:hypothetical protein
VRRRCSRTKTALREERATVIPVIRQALDELLDLERECHWSELLERTRIGMGRRQIGIRAGAAAAQTPNRTSPHLERLLRGGGAGQKKSGPKISERGGAEILMAALRSFLPMEPASTLDTGPEADCAGTRRKEPAMATTPESIVDALNSAFGKQMTQRARQVRSEHGGGERE